MKTYVLTGGPGHGKSLLLDRLAAQGEVIVPETARLIIAQERPRGSRLLPEGDLLAFQQMVAERQLATEDGLVATNGGRAFLDRGLIDGVAFCRLGGVPVPELIARHGRHRYHKVFLLDPLPTYVNDFVRRESQQEALLLHQAIAKAYQDFGYQTTSVPALPPAARLEFVLNNL